MNSIQHLLKSETQILHQKLESHPLHQLLFSPTLNNRSLQKILLAYLGFYLPIEIKLVDFVNDIYPTYKFQSPCIVLDLILLQTDMQKFLLCDHMPTIESKFNMLGALYVFEGARLGGVIINKHLKSVLPSNQVRFFANKSSWVAYNWANFGRMLESTVVTKSQCTLVINSAIETFRYFKLWLDSIEVVTESE